MPPKNCSPAPRNAISDGELAIRVVEDFSIFDTFYCYPPEQHDDLDDFIHNDAERHVKDRIAVCYAVYYLKISGFETQPVAFLSLQNDAIKLELADYPYRTSPAVKIGRLGVHMNFQHLGLGTRILTLIKRFMCTDNRTGCRFITLDAYNKPEILQFYIKKNGFNYYKTPSPDRKQEVLYFDLLWQQQTGKL